MLKPLPVASPEPPALRASDRQPTIYALAAALALIAPHLAAVLLANVVAERLDPAVGGWTRALAQRCDVLPTWLSPLVTGRFGLLTTAPLLLVWTIPTVLLHTAMQAVFAESGLLRRLARVAHPLIARVGLSGDDLVRVTMGFGCNVPAVVTSRRCGGCSRDACVSAIAFGAACSYQLGATLSIFAAARAAWLSPAYLFYLTGTMLLYVRLTSSPAARLAVLRTRMVPSVVRLPQPRRVAVAVRATAMQFTLQALPVFALFSMVAALLDASGSFERLSSVLAPALQVIGLPPDAAMALVMATVRKDGILLLKGAQLAPGSLLVAAYLASTLTPCLVTVWAIARTTSLRQAAVLLRRQAFAALAFTALLALAVRVSS